MDRLFAFLGSKITIRIPVQLFLWLPLIAYLGWEGYWFSQVGYAAIHWHTHLMPYVYIAVVGISILLAVYRRRPSGTVGKLLLAFCAVMFTLFAVELALTVSGAQKTTMERMKGYYKSPYEATDKTHYHLWPPMSTHRLWSSEFSYTRRTNSQGFSDREWAKQKRQGMKRILALGDSFTEGDGAPYDSSYVSLLAQLYRDHGDSVEVMNAGICDSDPFDNYIVLRDKLISYKPDIIIQSLATNDMNSDLIIKGGMERFQSAGSIKYRNAPWWESIYAINYTFRIFTNYLKYNQFLIKPIKVSEHSTLNNSMNNLFQKYALLSAKENIKLVIVIRPDMSEVINNKYDYDFSNIRSFLSHDSSIRVIDLMPRYHQYLKTNHLTASECYWRYDRHHNSKGYQMMAKTTYESISALVADSL